METTVKLQKMFSFSKVPIIVLGTIVVLYIVYLIIDKLFLSKRKNNKKPKKIKVKPKKVNIEQVRTKYLCELAEIENRYSAGVISTRESYQGMSEVIRLFVYDVTGIKVQSYTLEDIRSINMPALEELVQEYYKPEFSKKSEGDVMASVNKTKKAIERWN